MKQTKKHIVMLVGDKIRPYSAEQYESNISLMLIENSDKLQLLKEQTKQGTMDEAIKKAINVQLEQIEDIQQELFNYLHSELGVTALESQMHDIKRIIYKTQSKKLYSEEEVLNLMYYIRCNAIEVDTGWQMNNGLHYTDKELLEQFKKE